MARADGDAEAPESSVSLDYFDGLYDAKDDPWDTATKWHNQRKYAVTLASLPRERYKRCYEPGCSIGLLTVELAARCDEVLAVDCVDSAVAQTRTAIAGRSNASAEFALLPRDLPVGTFDLMVVSDLLYYLSADDLAATLDGLVSRLDEGGDLVSVHFRDRQNGGNYDGHNAHAALDAHGSLDHVVHHEDEWFLLDIYRKS